MVYLVNVLFGEDEYLRLDFFFFFVYIKKLSVVMFFFKYGDERI